MNYRYDEVKATQASAYFMKKYGGTLNYMKLIKLLYLANRVSFERHGEPIVPDTYVSMKHGPVLSCVLDSITNADQEGSFWSTHIGVTQGACVSLKKDPGFRNLSPRALAIMDEIDAEWHTVDRFEIVRWMHKNIPEWEDPNGSSYLIPVRRILQSVGKSSDEANYLIQEEMLYQREADILGNRTDLQGDGLLGEVRGESVPASACGDF